jgi:hypothetical protein
VGVLKRHARRLVRQKIRKPVRDALHGLAESWCPDCQKRVQPFHVCAPKSDFKQRRAQQARTARPRRRSAPKPARRPCERRQHDYTACSDQQCPRPLCKAFREGREACPLPHQG